MDVGAERRSTAGFEDGRGPMPGIVGSLQKLKKARNQPC